MSKPRLPTNPADQTGMSKVRAGANRKLSAALKRAAQKIYQRALELQPIAVESNNVEAPTKRYVYDLDPFRVAGINDWLQDVLYFELLGNEQGIWTQDWYLNLNMKMSVEAGTAKMLNDAQRIATPAIVGPETSAMMRAITISSALNDPGLIRRLQGVYAQTYNSVKSVSDDTRALLSGELTRGMANGKSPRWIARQLRKKTTDQEWKLLRVSRTEINQAYTNAYMEEQRDLNQKVYKGKRYRMDLIHLSALTSTTRERHAARHGTVTTRAEQEAWWDQGANRINCLCSVATILVNKKDGTPVDPTFVEEVKAQKKLYSPERV